MTRAIIIDDERHSRNLLRKMLVDFSEDVVVIGEAKSVQSGIALLQNLKPDVILLDIEMMDGDGFDVLDAFETIDFFVIFVTGFDEHAIKAIKYAAFDYLLKPVNLEELQLAIQKIKNAGGRKNEKLHLLRKPFENKENKLQQIVLPGRDNHVVVDIENIIRIEAHGSYVRVYLENKKSHLVVNSLNYYEELLPADNFFRVHKSNIININKIESFTPGRSSKVVLKDCSIVDIAARRKPAFNQVIRQLNG